MMCCNSAKMNITRRRIIMYVQQLSKAPSVIGRGLLKSCAQKFHVRVCHVRAYVTLNYYVMYKVHYASVLFTRKYEATKKSSQEPMSTTTVIVYTDIILYSELELNFFHSNNLRNEPALLRILRSPRRFLYWRGIASIPRRRHRFELCGEESRYLLEECERRPAAGR